MAVMRIDRFLAAMGEGTRSEVKNQIRKGCVSVNGGIVKSSDYKVDTQKDKVCLNGQPVAYVEYEYFMLNKPSGVLSAAKDPKATTVIDLIDSKISRDLFPVGRLDKDTEGLLLITNDGMLAHNLLSPRKHVDKVYYAKVEGTLLQQHIEEFAGGIFLEDGTKTLPARLEIRFLGPVSEILLTLQEGKFHQVKRMFEAIGCRVLYLKRLSMGSLVLDETLLPGDYRKLTEDEIHAIKG